MNLTNAVYEFEKEVVEASTEDGALYGSDVQESDADPVKSQKTVRISSATSQPDLIGDGTLREFNGEVSIEHLVRPDSQSLEHRAAAREVAHQMAMQSGAAIQNSTLGNRVCDARIVQKIDGYRNIQTARYQVSILKLLINQG